MKILLIEDEEMSLELLNGIINTYFPEVEVAASYSDAESALAFLERSPVDAVLTDIKLDGMSGIEFAEICTRKYPLMPIILISAYSDFEYARKAINTNVVSYILKPISFESLSGALNSVRKTVSSNNGKGVFSISKIQDYTMWFDRYFATGKETLSEESVELDIHSVSVCFLKIDDYQNYLKNVWPYGEERLVGEINQVLSSDNGAFAFVLGYEDGIFEIVFLFAKQEVKNFILKTTELLYKKLQINCTVTILLNASEVSCARQNVLEYTASKAVYRFLNGQSEGIATDGMSIQTLSRVATLLSENLIKYTSIEFVRGTGLKLDENNALNDHSELKNHVDLLIRAVNDYRRVADDDLVEKAMRYIERNYRQKLTLAAVADHVALSPKYFSRLFKKKTQKNVTEYIDDVRIRKAIDLMKKDKKIKNSNLSERLGYDTYSTFYKNFKKHTGMTPSQYIEQLKEE